MTVSDYPNMITPKYFHQNTVMPLSEANLCKHTMQMSPVSRQAKLVHIIGYVDRQRELVSSEEPVHQAMKASATKSSRLVAARGAGASAPATVRGGDDEMNSVIYDDITPSGTITPMLTSTNIHAQLPIAMRMRSQQIKPTTHQHSQQLSIKKTPEKRMSEPIVSPMGIFAYQQQQNQLQLRSPYRDASAGAMDPSMALPRALPRKLPTHSYDLSSLYSPVDSHFQNVDEYDAQSLNSPAQDWRQDPRLRPMYNRSPLVRQDSSESMERAKKLGRLGNSFAFLSKSKLPQLRRKSSEGVKEENGGPAIKHEYDNRSDSEASKDQSQSQSQSRLQSLTYRSGRAVKAAMAMAAMAAGAGAGTDSSETQSEDIKPRGTVKQLFMDVFKKSSKAPQGASSPDAEPENQRFSLWSPNQQHAVDIEDSLDSLSSDYSPHTTVQSPEPTPSSTTLRPSGSFDRLYKYGFEEESDDDEGEDTEKKGKSGKPEGQDLMPIAALIRELSAFGLDYVHHQPYSSQQNTAATQMGQEQSIINIEGAGLQHHHQRVVAAM
ncbi:hypothetical protein BX616_002051 [Lobosporangium transversale]|nr:hypothetical protein BX616_002051 [Lobosporangium transversale]